MSSTPTHTASNENLASLKKTKDINGNNSVASSLNSIVKKQFINMTEQYNLYASAITEMEEKIKALKSIMLSDTFLKNCQHMALSCDANGIESFGNVVTNRKNNKKTIPNTNNGTSGASDCVEPTNTILISSQHPDQQPSEYSTCNDYFTPKQSDSLFWCFYILCNGYKSYEYETNYFTAEQQFKIHTVEKVKRGDNKQILKDNKISKNSFESGLMGTITPKVLHALCIFYGINIFYVHNNTYYDMIIDSAKPISIIRYNAETHNYSVGMGIGGDILNETHTAPKFCEYIEKIKESHWKLESLEKPLRAITSYSVMEIIDICNKLDISIINESNKKKTKADLYSSILQKL
jgi:hypothetical protein